MRSIAAGGEGVARLPDGMTVFVPRTCPDELVRLEVVERHRRWARARLVDVVRPGPARVAPLCPHYEVDGCGGCQLQHLALPAQHEAKRAIVREALRRLGGRLAETPDLIAAPDPWRYRAKVTLAVAEGGRRIGFHRFDRPGDVFDLDVCLIADPRITAIWVRVRQARAFLPADTEQIVLRLDQEGAPHLLVVGGTPPWDPEPLSGAIGAPSLTLWWEPAGGAARAVAGRKTGFPALAFSQVNPALADRIRRDAVAWLAEAEPRVVWDLYGGVGEAACLLAGAGASVWSVDADRSAVEWGAAQPAEGGVTAPRFLHGRVEEVLHRLPNPDAVLLNPPRGGTAPEVCHALDRWGGRGGSLRRMAYVSCDPATLARDLRRLAGFRLRGVTAYDLFPQTSHVETVALLEAA